MDCVGAEWRGGGVGEHLRELLRSHKFLSRRPISKTDVTDDTKWFFQLCTVSFRVRSELFLCVCVCVMTIMMCTYICNGRKGVVAWNRVRSVFVRINEKLNVDACALCADCDTHARLYREYTMRFVCGIIQKYLYIFIFYICI